MTISDDAHITQSMYDILHTPIGSRVMRREYGSLLSELIDEPDNKATRLKVMSACYMALMRWEPRISLQRIEVKPDENNVPTLYFQGTKPITSRLRQKFPGNHANHRHQPVTAAGRDRSVRFRTDFH